MPRANRIAADFLREQMRTDGIKSSELSSVFTEEPPDLDTFLYDSSYLNHLRPTLPTVDSDGYAFELSPIQRDFLRSFEQIFFPELYIAMVEEFGPRILLQNQSSATRLYHCKQPIDATCSPTSTLTVRGN